MAQPCASNRPDIAPAPRRSTKMVESGRGSKDSTQSADKISEAPANHSEQPIGREEQIPESALQLWIDLISDLIAADVLKELSESHKLDENSPHK
jgi:hypothetical protein